MDIVRWYLAVFALFVNSSALAEPTAGPTAARKVRVNISGLTSVNNADVAFGFPESDQAYVVAVCQDPRGTLSTLKKGPWDLDDGERKFTDRKPLTVWEGTLNPGEAAHCAVLWMEEDVEGFAKGSKRAIGALVKAFAHKLPATINLPDAVSPDIRFSWEITAESPADFILGALTTIAMEIATQALSDLAFAIGGGGDNLLGGAIISLANHDGTLRKQVAPLTHTTLRGLSSTRMTLRLRSSYYVPIDNLIDYGIQIQVRDVTTVGGPDDPHKDGAALTWTLEGRVAR